MPWYVLSCDTISASHVIVIECVFSSICLRCNWPLKYYRHTHMHGCTHIVYHLAAGSVHMFLPLNGSLIISLCCGKYQNYKVRLFRNWTLQKLGDFLSYHSYGPSGYTVSVNFSFIIDSSCSLLPLGIASLIAGKLVEVESYSILVQDLGLYMVTVLSGLFIHALIVLPLIYFIITRRNPFALMGQVSQALLTAFGTSSR